MSRRTNGGLIGKSISLTSGTINGRWGAVDQAIHQNANRWKYIPTVIGEACYDGYYAGIIDTTVGNIIAADASQTGAKYALIVSPKSLQTITQWKTTNTAGPTGVRTRWDGLGATTAMAAGGSAYPAATYCNGLSYPSDGGSQWYLPAFDELELVYRNFKPTTTSNQTTSSTSNPSTSFPYNGATYVNGYNVSSSPVNSSYTASVPAQTSITSFRTGNAQAIEGGSFPYVWSSTEDDATYGAWLQVFVQVSGGGVQGLQYAASTTSDSKTYNYIVRPVRRILIP